MRFLGSKQPNSPSPTRHFRETRAGAAAERSLHDDELVSPAHNHSLARASGSQSPAGGASVEHRDPVEALRTRADGVGNAKLGAVPNQVTPQIVPEARRQIPSVLHSVRFAGNALPDQMQVSAGDPQARN